MNNIRLNINEKRDILSQHGSIPTQQYLFENHISIDGRFLLFQDNIFDLIENKLIGNISTSIDNFIFLIENIKFPEGPELKIINEIKGVFSSLVISESTSDWKLIVEQAKEEKSWWEKGKEWVSNKVDTANKILKEKGLGALIGASALYIGRKIKSALWSASGMIIDAFLVASGIGKSVQWIPWAIAFLTDVYQWSTGDYGDDTEFKESSTFWKILTLVFEILGMLSAGPVALAARKLFGPVKAFKSESQIATWVSKNPQAKTMLQKAEGLLSGVATKLSSMKNSFSKTFPQLSKWIGTTLSKVGGFLTKIGSFLKKIFTLLGAPGRVAKKAGDALSKTNVGQRMVKAGYDVGKGLQAATNTAMVLGGANVAVGAYSDHQQNKQEQELIKSIEQVDVSNFEF
jgi:hypothetical protein